MANENPGAARRKDMRGQRTRQALSDALFRLLANGEFQKITVNDLCVEASISRATFYTHFEDKYHLLRYSLATMADSLPRQAGGKDEAMVRQLVGHLSSHAGAYRNLLLGEHSQELLLVLNRLFVRSFTQTLHSAEQSGMQFRLPVPVLAAFLAGGAVGLLTCWLGGTLPVPDEEMAEYILVLSREEWMMAGP